MKMTRAQWLGYARAAARRDSMQAAQNALSMRMAFGAEQKVWSEYLDTLKE